MQLDRLSSYSRADIQRHVRLLCFNDYNTNTVMMMAQ
jgi:hypothetical protein